MSDEQEGQTPPHPPRRGAAPSPAGGEGLVVSPNKNRVVQVRHAGSRKLFDKARKEVFLEWFAATCNVRLSAAKAGISDKTVYKHLLKDPEFEEAFGRALRLGYVRLEARQLQEAHRVGFAVNAGGDAPSTGVVQDPSTSSAGPPPPGELGEEYEIGILDDELVEEHFDPQLALQLLREHRRHLPGAAEKRPAQRTTAQGATNQEIAEALAKRLKGFALRTLKPPADDTAE